MNPANSPKDSKVPATLPFHMQFIAGAVAGISETLVMYPLDVVKTRFQIQTGQGEYRSVLDCFRKIVRQEGVGTLYRGIIAPILVEAPKRAVKFAANEQYCKWALQLSGERRMTQALSVATGVSTGLTEAFVVVSFELVKIRMQDKANAQRYKNSLDCALQVLRAEGPRAFFRGLEATLWRHGAWNGGYFGVIHWVKGVLPRAESPQAAMLNNFAAGAVGGAVGTALNTPFDVVKTRIQGGVAPYRWAFPGLAVVLREEGVKALYKGFVPKVLRLGPGGGVLLVVFDAVSSWLRDFV